MNANKRFSFAFIVVSIGYILLGLSLLLYPQISPQVICYILAALGAVLGLFFIGRFFAKSSENTPRNDLALGVVLVALGIFLFTLRETAAFVSLLYVFLGFAVLYDSMMKLTISFDIRKAGVSFWWAFVILSFITALLAILLIINPFEAPTADTYFACVLLADGIINLLVWGFATVSGSKAFQKHREKKGDKAKKQAQEEAKQATGLHEPTPPPVLQNPLEEQPLPPDTKPDSTTGEAPPEPTAPPSAKEAP